MLYFGFATGTLFHSLVAPHHPSGPDAVSDVYRATDALTTLGTCFSVCCPSLDAIITKFVLTGQNPGVPHHCLAEISL